MPRSSRTILLSGLAILLLTLVRTAWVSDDAYISFRTADNILNGYGPVWNAAERVQAFTHPLWLGLCTMAFALLSNAFFTSIALGIVLTLIAVWLIGSRLAVTPQQFVLSLVVLLSSKAWIDYSTSGLENALTHVLLVLFVIAVTDQQTSLLELSFIASLLALNRLDLILLVGPALAYAVWRSGVRAASRPLAIGLLPLIAWLLFATLYYGTPFPNTAYAKLTNALTATMRWSRGIDYLERTFFGDPVTLPAIALTLFAIERARWARDVMLPLGVLLYLLYIVSIGGDFMMGRFLTAPLTVGVALLARATWLRSMKVAAGAAVGVLLLGLTAPWEPALLSGYGYAYAYRQLFGTPAWGDGDPPTIRVDRITDERLAYYEATGLLKVGLRGLPPHPWVVQGRQLRVRPVPVVVFENVGFRGYYAGPRVHIVDTLALADPLLARLPGGNENSIMGHFVRPLPAGYLETIAGHTNRLADPDLAAYYEQLHLIVSGPLWSTDRLRAIATMLAGSHDAALQRYVASQRRADSANDNRR